MVEIWVDARKMQVLPDGHDRLAAADDASPAALAASDGLAPARGVVYGALLGLMAWAALAAAFWG